ncbi:MAG: 3-dehydroquinate synthase [Candidatus Woesearchaeota archaeon]|nr:3-dehydroquinate synthase [Candidatus Woesearchaeota archaeon]
MDKIVGRGIWKKHLLEMEGKIAIVADSIVKELNKADFLELEKKHQVMTIMATEANKSRNTKHEIEDMLLEEGHDRNLILVAIGGGIITDITGYVASTFKRGIRYVNVPTTLLAMVDASIGGKTGVNTKHGKNMLGSVWHPTEVIIDLDFLETLPDDEFISGIAEIIKIAAALDEELFMYLEKNKEKIMQRDDEAIRHVISRAIELKLSVVESDERDDGKRHVLNLGHTIGHAVESALDFKIKHGFAVSIGLVFESKVACSLEKISEKDVKRITRLLEKFGLPTKLPDLDEERLIRHMMLDKKSENGNVNMVLLDGIGKVHSSKNRFSHKIDLIAIRKLMRGQ